MTNIPYSTLLLVLLITLAGFVHSLQLVSRDPGMKPNAKPPPTCAAGDMGKQEGKISAYGSIASEGDAFLNCCSKHLQCYCICEKNISKQVCDEGFRRCVQTACLAGLPNKTNFEKRRCTTGWSWTGPGMVNPKVANSVEFSCNRYQEVQASCCPS
ncbi:hypothetical protein K7432_012953 [Basidiobolus ranarum]|uniref:Uncharacterized protein n=1 Tax=Basidiobolus ranarum TaxID=34480 RepID=A0ABR2WK04_9FUNG